ncbi:unnamed protein product [Adineta steineri]|uniref:Uncharacterized protein n=1 Tax=Adineta steineri TaxID=433720 RepID=A0A819XKN6_9BILA|nr:unnamed protein product [Adineta steineri]CAF4144092.1 unnamed protein product [Adineta steineri]
MLVAVMVAAIVQGVPVTDNHMRESCEAHFYSYGADPCDGTVSVRGGCKSSTLNFAHTNTSKTCTSVKFFWSYPVDNLTMIIETPFTEKQQQYSIKFNVDRTMGAITNVFRIFGREEILITPAESKLIQPSDSNYQIILKLQGPSKLTSYGVFIDYEVVYS